MSYKIFKKNNLNPQFKVREENGKFYLYHKSSFSFDPSPTPTPTPTSSNIVPTPTQSVTPTSTLTPSITPTNTVTQSVEQQGFVKYIVYVEQQGYADASGCYFRESGVPIYRNASNTGLYIHKPFNNEWVLQTDSINYYSAENNNSDYPPLSGWSSFSVEYDPPPTLDEECPSITCFTPDSLVLMADNTSKRIDSINIGDKVTTFDNNVGIVTKISKPIVGYRGLLSINNSKPFATSDHLFKSVNNTWLSADLEGSKKTFPAFDSIQKYSVIKQMQIGDYIYLSNNLIQIENFTIVNQNTFDDTIVYDLSLNADSNHTYFVNNFAVHNCDPCIFANFGYDNCKQKCQTEEIVNIQGVASCIQCFNNNRVFCDEKCCAESECCENGVCVPPSCDDNTCPDELGEKICYACLAPGDPDWPDPGYGIVSYPDPCGDLDCESLGIPDLYNSPDSCF